MASSPLTSDHDALELEIDDGNINSNESHVLTPPPVLPPSDFPVRHPMMAENPTTGNEEWVMEDALITTHQSVAMLSGFSALLLSFLVGFGLMGTPLEVPIVHQWHTVLPEYSDHTVVVNPSVEVSSLAIISLSLLFVENVSCGVLFKTRFLRMVEVRMNPVREIFYGISICLLRVQLALLTGILEPVGLYFIAMLTLAGCALHWSAECQPNRPVAGSRAFAICTSIATWAILWVYYVHSQQTAHSLQYTLMVLTFGLCAFELAYAWKLARFSESPSKREQSLTLTSFTMRTFIAWTVVLSINGKQK